MTFTIRLNTTDHAILHDVVELDEYKLRGLSHLGFRPRLIVDIGGHIGGFVAAAASVWPEATILSFEAFRPNYELLVRNTAQFASARAFQAAVVGDDSLTTVKFSWPEATGNTGGGGLCATGDVVVPAYGVDRLSLLAYPNRIDLLKLDCEGSEEDILTGFAKLNLVHHLGIVCGEWHGVAKREAIRKILSPSHLFKNIPHPDPSVLDLGLFYAIPVPRPTVNGPTLLDLIRPHLQHEVQIRTVPSGRNGVRQEPTVDVIP